MKKNIGLVTLPLIANYGGILQCLSMNYFLKKHGYNVTLIDIRPKNTLFRRILINTISRIPFQDFKGLRKKHLKQKNNVAVINRYITSRTPCISNNDQLKYIADSFEFDAVIVGSDQVWRYEYINSSMYDAYFLGFVNKETCKKISYAASFGVDKWFHEDKKNKTMKLLHKFDYISVREQSGVDICNNEFKIDNAVHVLDPTLLDTSFYDDLLKEMKPTAGDSKYLLRYILDETKTADIVENAVFESVRFDYTIDIMKARKNYTIQDWVSAFKNAEYIITDSFHGMVFAIIFNKRFIAIGNRARGLSRFSSFLNIINLECKLISTEDIAKKEALAKVIDYEPDYQEINNTIDNWRKKSTEFLLSSLK
ncbi:polysaccharide pyruvyl transferase family protein [Siccibacter colletis]|uniref:polysaccharide pyruvyl transferase family protein n=1 Tax=Siccibacter colletis TaxID=1505757 RepID=UPI0028BE3EC7|nr:polysaccharide pyruvyl transferase family protein [Siccibacter colletis]WNN47300.1 polysaccharide pyruvyl transferase family protein [Siccibacter colletis]